MLPDVLIWGHTVPTFLSKNKNSHTDRGGGGKQHFKAQAHTNALILLNLFILSFIYYESFKKSWTHFLSCEEIAKFLMPSWVFHGLLVTVSRTEHSSDPPASQASVAGNHQAPSSLLKAQIPGTNNGLLAGRCKVYNLDARSCPSRSPYAAAQPLQTRNE